MGTGKFVVAGLLAGLGDSMVKVGAAKREAALRELELTMRAMENDKDRTFRAGENEADRNFRAGEGEKDREFRAGESAADRAAREKENAEDREYKDAALDLDRRRLGLTEEEFNYKKKNGLLGGSSELVEVYDPDSPTGTKYVPKSQAAGMPGKTGASDARDAQQADRAQAELDAEEQATREAKAKAGWFTSDTKDFGPEGREAWIKKRTKEILNGDEGKPAAESGAGGAADGEGAGSAQPEQKPGAPKGDGTRANPYKATSQSEVDWFKANAPKGAVLDVKGTLYTK